MLEFAYPGINGLSASSANSQAIADAAWGDVYVTDEADMAEGHES
jgi:hypothetical protein